MKNHIVNIHEAKTHLSRLLEEVAGGGEVVIAKFGKPVARLVPISSTRPQRRFGLLKGQIWMADDFNAPLPDGLQADFEGRGE